MTVLVPLIVAFAFVAATVALVTARSGRAALHVLLDLLLAAGLLQLSIGLTWTQIAVAASVVILRRLVMAALVLPGRGSA